MQVRKVLIIEGMVNVIITLIKLAVGIMTNSAAIIGDALHSLTDVANNIIAFLMVKVSESPADNEHPYGHYKFEQLAVFALAVLLTVVAFELIINALQSFSEPVEQSLPGLLIMFLVLIANISLTLWERYWAKRLYSDYSVCGCQSHIQ